MTGLSTPGTASTPPPNLLSRLFRAREASLILILLALVAMTTAINPRFLTPQSMRDLALNVAIIGLVVVGQTLVLLMKHVDLSVSSTLGLTAFLTGSLFVANPSMPIGLAFVAGVGIGALLGAVNGLLVAYGKVPALVATLGTLYVFRGVDYAVVQGGQITASNLPAAFSSFASSSVLGVPSLVLLVLVVMALFSIYLRSYRAGREYYAVGSNVEAASLAGINVSRRVMTGFILSGAIAGLAGVLYLARYGTVDAAAGTGLELQVIAAAVVGGVAITGGVGTIAGAGIGALLLGVIGSALVALRAPAFWQQAIQGALLLLAISIDIVVARRAARVMQERSHR
ncbi:ABC transporter permease [Deinococcus deserti]|uniref:Autoinducer 2 import system permease protein LsrC n=1 Tax=Deinococcus deserti (strain DSM 17065 / CIP 109153 / LMG 22923 / VCD115) TaxID=546414 RepID=C1D3L3_DEIDV|nr:ABC transporter permease [Deinococcus deserti]ACO48092.2 putative ribose/xylose/arabinose/galactoside ABC transporter, permease component [Deinococcus deserti VCD115]